jgi:hypothetical protein
VQTIGICNIVYELIVENFPNLKKEMPIQVQESSTTPKRHDQSRIFEAIFLLKQLAWRTRKEY